MIPVEFMINDITFLSWSHNYSANVQVRKYSDQKKTLTSTEIISWVLVYEEE